MIEMPFEKEIKVKNKIKNLTLRQSIAVAIAVIIGFLICFIGNISADNSWIVFIAVAGISFGLGWYNKNGLYIEAIGEKKLLLTLYQNKRRNYRSLNQYISLYNKEYRKIKNKDMQDKKILKETKKADKILQKKRKKTTMKGFA